MDKFIRRKVYVPGFFMIKHNQAYSNSFEKRLSFIGIMAFATLWGIGTHLATTNPAKNVANERF